MVDPDAMGVTHVDPPYGYRCPFGGQSAATCGELAADAIGRRIDLGADRVAAVIVETNTGSKHGIVAPNS